MDYLFSNIPYQPTKFTILNISDLGWYGIFENNLSQRPTLAVIAGLLSVLILADTFYSPDLDW